MRRRAEEETDLASVQAMMWGKFQEGRNGFTHNIVEYLKAVWNTFRQSQIFANSPKDFQTFCKSYSPDKWKISKKSDFFLGGLETLKAVCGQFQVDFMS